MGDEESPTGIGIMIGMLAWIMDGKVWLQNMMMIPFPLKTLTNDSEFFNFKCFVVIVIYKAFIVCDIRFFMDLAQRLIKKMSSQQKNRIHILCFITN